MNITKQDCIDGREAVRRDGVIVKLTSWAGFKKYPARASDGRVRRKGGLRFHGQENPKDLLCWREDLVHEVPGFTVAHAQKALGGKFYGLTSGFVWEASPQGDGYWVNLYNAMYRGEPLPDDARDILIASIAVAKREAETKPAETPETTEPTKQPLVQIVVSVPLDRVAELHEFAAGLCEENGK